MQMNGFALRSAALVLTLGSFVTGTTITTASATGTEREFLNQEAGINTRPDVNPRVDAQTPQTPRTGPQTRQDRRKPVKTASLFPAFETEPEAAPAPRAAAPALAPAADANISAMVDRYAAAAGVPAHLARGVVRVESNFNPRVTGRAGEVGLMQIKYQTARGMGFTGTRAQLYDPATNLEWGMKYLAQAYRLGGNTDCGAVLRYQAGHGAKRMTGAAQAYCAKIRRQNAAN
jgi:soluble lytic murein transglycosylase-like protein